MIFSPTIHVHITREHFVFQYEGQELHLEACIHYLLEGNEVTPVAIGDRVEIPNAHFADLFKPKEPYTDHFYLLELLLEYGFGRMLGKRLLPSKPDVIFHGVEQLYEILSGYQFGIFEKAALQAGVRSVKFEQ
ncbi:MAG TPA: hypothetical protein PK414_10910 [Anaerolineales bacterium]|nr:hypothetical protein [Anaerolineales bacterium]